MRFRGRIPPTMCQVRDQMASLQNPFSPTQRVSSLDPLCLQDSKFLLLTVKKPNPEIDLLTSRDNIMSPKLNFSRPVPLVLAVRSGLYDFLIWSAQ